VVPIKAVTQQVVGALHRLRSGWLGERTRRINALRGLLRELGFFIPEGRKHVLPEAWDIIQADSGLPAALKPSMAALCEEIVSLSTRIEEIEKQLETLAKQLPAVARLRSVPGIGLLTATGRYRTLPVGPAPGQLPRADAAGILEWPAPAPGKDLETRRRLPAPASDPRSAGDPLAREAAEAAGSPARVGAQAREEDWPHHSKAAVALANKLARIAWAVWKRDRNFEPTPEAKAA
jgi:transposase